MQFIKPNLIICFSLVSYFITNSQTVTNDGLQSYDTAKTYIVIKHDHSQFVGKILSADPRELMIETKTIGKVIIPKHEIKEIKEIRTNELNNKGEYLPDEIFSTRYFITTNGLPIEKGESYIQWSLHGPDFQLGIGKNFGVGIMTSWVGMPVIGTAKYSIKLSKNFSAGIGTLLGTGSWAMPEAAMALPFATLTFGNRKANLNISGGYGAISYKKETEGRYLFSAAGLIKTGKKVSILFDSFIIPAGGTREIVNYGYTETSPGVFTSYTYITKEKKRTFALLIPGIRWQMDPVKAFQFGFAGVYFDKSFVPVPIPVVSWYRQL